MLRTLHRRPRGRALAPLLSALTHGRIPAGPDPVELARRLRRAEERMPELAREIILDTARRHAIPAYPVELEAPSQSLVERAGADVTSVVEPLLEPDIAEFYAGQPEAARRQWALNFAAHHDVEEVLERTGLTSVMPPDEVHAMARGPLAAGGDPRMADLVVGALERAGAQLSAGDRVLDFGCSSGRVLRVLRAWRDDIEWLGCDPNAGAVAWAGEHLDGIEAFVSPVEPPLALEDDSLDVVFAISIWSHFGPNVGQRWLGEMRRVLRPGGRLVLTTQGFASLAKYLEIGIILLDDAERCLKALVSEGHWYADLFGPDGDHGVTHDEWGMAYMTPEWLLEVALPAWTVELYEPGRLDASQDVWVLGRA